MSLSISAIGEFVDSKAGQIRTPAAVAGRLLEEVVELGLAAGLSAADVMGHVADALHNQALKASSEGKTIFPTQLTSERSELPEECADVQIVLKDLSYVAGVDLKFEEAAKWKKFTQKHFRVSPNGTIYAIKPHIK